MVQHQQSPVLSSGNLLLSFRLSPNRTGISGLLAVIEGCVVIKFAFPGDSNAGITSGLQQYVTVNLQSAALVR